MGGTNAAPSALKPLWLISRSFGKGMCFFPHHVFCIPHMCDSSPQTHFYVQEADWRRPRCTGARVHPPAPSTTTELRNVSRAASLGPQPCSQWAGARRPFFLLLATRHLCQQRKLPSRSSWDPDKAEQPQLLEECSLLTTPTPTHPTRPKAPSSLKTASSIPALCGHSHL